MKICLFTLLFFLLTKTIKNIFAGPAAVDAFKNYFKVCLEEIYSATGNILEDFLKFHHMQSSLEELCVNATDLLE